MATHQEVFDYFDTDLNGFITEADDHSYFAANALTLEFDGDFVDGNAADALALRGISSLELGHFGDVS